MSLIVCTLTLSLAAQQPTIQGDVLAKTTPTSQTSDAENDPKTLVEAFYQAFQANDTKALGDLLSANYGVSNASEVQESSYSKYTEMSKNIKVRASAMKKALPDFTIKIDDMISEDNKVLAKVTINGIQKGDFFGIAPTNKPISIKIFALFTFKNGKITNINEMWSEYAVMKQLGYVVL